MSDRNKKYLIVTINLNGSAFVPSASLRTELDCNALTVQPLLDIIKARKEV